MNSTEYLIICYTTTLNIKKWNQIQNVKSKIAVNNFINNET